MERPQDRKVEPLFAALEEAGEDPPATARSGAARSSLVWRLVVAAVVLAALLATVLHQAY